MILTKYVSFFKRHGCVSCYPQPDTKNPVNNKLMYGLYQSTIARELCIKRTGIKVESIWECDFEKQMKANPAMKDYIDSINLQEKINPRDAFYGGRTNAARLFYEAQKDEEIDYYDFTR